MGYTFYSGDPWARTFYVSVSNPNACLDGGRVLVDWNHGNFLLLLEARVLPKGPFAKFTRRTMIPHALLLF
jgi:hypothetical protein